LIQIDYRFGCECVRNYLRVSTTTKKKKKEEGEEDEKQQEVIGNRNFRNKE